jgi:capsular exopolysaccharide synthesis family protein
MAFESDRPDPRPFLRSIWRRRWWLGAMILLIPAVVFVVSILLPERYEASTTLQTRATTAESAAFSSQLSPAAPSVQDAARLVDTTTVAQEAAEELGETPMDAEELLDEVTAIPEADPGVETAQLFTITAQADTPEGAADLANAFAAGLRTVLVRQSLESIDATLESLRSGDTPTRKAARRQLDEQIQELEAIRASRPASLQIVEPATAPRGPVSPRPLRNTALAVILSVLLAGALVPLLDRLDRHVHDPDELEDLAQARLLAAVPDSAFGRSPGGLEREAFQTLRTSLMYFNVDRPITSLLIASPGAGDGKTTVAMNLAGAMARADMDVLLVDADLRASPIAARTGASGRHGLASVLLEDVDPGDAIETVELGGVPFRILSGGTAVADPPAVLGSKRFRALLQDLESETDVVIVDTPPILAVSDAIPLLNQVSGVLVVGRMEQTTREGFWRAVRVSRSAEGTVLGVVATGVRDELRDAYGGYYTADDAPAGHPGVPSSSSA